MFSFNKQYDTSSDEELMVLVVKGNDKAFGELYKRYSKNMLYFFYQRLYQNNEKAQDFLQDLFLNVIEKGSLYNPDRKFKAWIYTVAANMCKNEYRSNAVRGVRVNDFDFNEVLDEVSCAHLTQRFDQVLFAKLLSEELGKLNDDQNLTFELKYFCHLSINEISEIMSCSEGTVKSRLFYSIKTLARKLEFFNPYK